MHWLALQKTIVRKVSSPFKGLESEEAKETIATPIGDVTLSACWWNEQPYICARFDLNIGRPPYIHYTNAYGWRGYLCQLLDGNGASDSQRLWIPSPINLFNEVDLAHPSWDPFRDDIESHVAPLLGPWGLANRHRFDLVRAALQRERIEQAVRHLHELEAQLAELDKPLRRWRHAAATIDERLYELDVDPSADFTGEGWKTNRYRTPDGTSIALQVRVFSRLGLVVATREPELQRAIRAQIASWWAHWGTHELLSTVLGWFWVGEKMISRGRPDRATLRVEPNRLYPVIEDTDADAVAARWFQRNEWRLLVGARGYVRNRGEAAQNRFDEFLPRVLSVRGHHASQCPEVGELSSKSQQQPTTSSSPGTKAIYATCVANDATGSSS